MSRSSECSASALPLEAIVDPATLLVYRSYRWNTATLRAMAQTHRRFCPRWPISYESTVWLRNEFAKHQSKRVCQWSASPFRRCLRSFWHLDSCNLLRTLAIFTALAPRLQLGAGMTLSQPTPAERDERHPEIDASRKSSGSHRSCHERSERFQCALHYFGNLRSALLSSFYRLILVGTAHCGDRPDHRPGHRH
jgi:hypothetical protein